MRFSTIVLSLSVGASASVLTALDPGQSIAAMTQSADYASRSLEAALENAKSAESVEDAAASTSAASAMASLEADMAHMRTVVQAASSESAYLSSISASQSSMMSKISASQSSMTARAASSAQAAQSSASSAAAEASRVMVSLSSESVSRQAEATKQPVHGQMFTCDDSESTSDYGACCERYLILMEGENVMLAPQDCKKAATANNQTAYRCTTDNPFGLCCVETDSKMKQCGSAKTMFKLEDFSKASEQAPTNMSWTLQKELQGSMGRFMQGGI